MYTYIHIHTIRYTYIHRYIHIHTIRYTHTHTHTHTQIHADKREMLINEIEVMKNLDHPNIIRLYETFRSKPPKLNQLICLYETYSDQANDKLHLAKP